MSYFQIPATEATTYPISVANGGTGATTPSEAITNLSSPAFNNSAQSVDWGVISVAPPAAPDAAANSATIIELLNTLTALGVIGA
jgi:hypothetical protein